MDWEFLKLKGETNKNNLVQIKGISEQLNSDGSLNTTGEGVIDKFYSRKALMTFHSSKYWHKQKCKLIVMNLDISGVRKETRRIGRIIVTCPTAMSRIEQIALRKCAEDAAIILERFYGNIVNRS